MPKFIVRIVTEESEVEALNHFIHAVAITSCRDFYTERQLAVLNEVVFGIHHDDGAIADKTFFVIECESKTIATGGWSIRKQKPDDNPFLIPGTDPARIRTFFVDPEYHNKGLGALLLQLCENAALAAGFKSTVLYATLNGESFYDAHGYKKLRSVGPGITPGTTPLNGEILEFTFMEKTNLVEHDLKNILTKLATKEIEIQLPITRKSSLTLRG